LFNPFHGQIVTLKFTEFLDFFENIFRTVIRWALQKATKVAGCWFWFDYIGDPDCCTLLVVSQPITCKKQLTTKTTDYRLSVTFLEVI
jgi:hypothetical protein